VAYQVDDRASGLDVEQRPDEGPPNGTPRGTTTAVLPLLDTVSLPLELLRAPLAGSTHAATAANGSCSTTAACESDRPGAGPRERALCPAMHTAGLRGHSAAVRA